MPHEVDRWRPRSLRSQRLLRICQVRCEPGKRTSKKISCNFMSIWSLSDLIMKHDMSDFFHTYIYIIYIYIYISISYIMFIFTYNIAFFVLICCGVGSSHKVEDWLLWDGVRSLQKKKVHASCIIMPWVEWHSSPFWRVRQLGPGRAQPAQPAVEPAAQPPPSAPAEKPPPSNSHAAKCDVAGGERWGKVFAGFGSAILQCGRSFLNFALLAVSLHCHYSIL